MQILSHIARATAALLALSTAAKAANSYRVDGYTIGKSEVQWSACSDNWARTNGTGRKWEKAGANRTSRLFKLADGLTCTTEGLKVIPKKQR